MKFKRVVAGGDMHCGHRTGLTPSKWEVVSEQDKYCEIRRECRDFYNSTIDALKPIDIFVHNGDATDGKGKRSGGTELIWSARSAQKSMCVENLKRADADHYVLTHGTPYHVGTDEDWETEVVDEMKAGGYDIDIAGQQWIEVNGTTFDIKHKVGASTIPHGRSTPVKKEQLWNLIWADVGEQPKSNIFLRSHVHYMDFSGTPTYLAMTLPALQGQGTKFGSRQCSGIVDFGLVWFDCYENGTYTWSWKVLRAESQRQEARVL
jgi:hypothetical protein